MKNLKAYTKKFLCKKLDADGNVVMLEGSPMLVFQTLIVHHNPAYIPHK